MGSLIGNETFIMHNQKLGHDYIQRAEIRLSVLDVLFEKKSWADVVRGSQEVVELCLKGLLRLQNIDFPRTHDVSAVLLENRDLIPVVVFAEVDRLAEISRTLRRDRELAFYGGEDLTPTEFYKESDAVKAREEARFTVATVKRALTA